MYAVDLVALEVMELELPRLYGLAEWTVHRANGAGHGLCAVIVSATTNMCMSESPVKRRSLDEWQIPMMLYSTLPLTKAPSAIQAAADTAALVVAGWCGRSNCGAGAGTGTSFRLAGST